MYLFRLLSLIPRHMQPPSTQSLQSTSSLLSSHHSPAYTPNTPCSPLQPRHKSHIPASRSRDILNPLHAPLPRLPCHNRCPFDFRCCRYQSCRSVRRNLHNGGFWIEERVVGVGRPQGERRGESRRRGGTIAGTVGSELMYGFVRRRDYARMDVAAAQELRSG